MTNEAELLLKIEKSIVFAKKLNTPAKWIKDVILAQVFLTLLCAYIYTDFHEESAREWGFEFVKSGFILIGAILLVRAIQSVVAVRVIILAKQIPENPVAKKILEGDEDD